MTETVNFVTVRLFDFSKLIPKTVPSSPVMWLFKSKLQIAELRQKIFRFQICPSIQIRQNEVSQNTCTIRVIDSKRNRILNHKCVLARTYSCVYELSNSWRCFVQYLQGLRISAVFEILLNAQSFFIIFLKLFYIIRILNLEYVFIS